VAQGEQAIDGVRADEAGTAGDEDPHWWDPFPVVPALLSPVAIMWEELEQWKEIPNEEPIAF
jgi:hypothetical protein